MASETMYGVRRESITDEVWQGVIGAYLVSAVYLGKELQVKPDDWQFRISKEHVLGDSYADGLRLGSVISENSKLHSCWSRDWEVVHFTFDHDADDFELAVAEQIYGVTPDIIQEMFRDRTCQLFEALKIGEAIDDCLHIQQL